MRIINGIPQRGDDWKAWRLAGLTATDAEEILRGGLGWLSLWRKKTRRAADYDLSSIASIERGVEFEPVARAAAEEHFGDLLLPVCVEHEHERLFRASLDGLLGDGCPVELKCPGHEVWADVWLNGVASQAVASYRPQLHWQTLTTGAPHAWLCFYEVESRQVLVFKIERDPPMIDLLIEQARKFWTYVERDALPPIGANGNIAKPLSDQAGESILEPNAAELPDWERLADQLRDLTVRKAALDAAVEDLDGRINSIHGLIETRMGEYRYACGGGVFATRSHRRGSIDYKKLADELGVPDGERERYRRAGSETLKIELDDPPATQSKPKAA